MDNRMALKQAREAYAFHIAQSPDTVTGARAAMVPGGFGGMVPDPFGTKVPFTVTVRLSHERHGVSQQQETPAGLDTALSLFLQWPWNVTFLENDIITARGRKFKVGPPDALKKFGGIQGWQAPLIPAGEIPA